MVLPFVTIWSKLFFCSLADRHRAYRSFFIFFLMTAMIGYGSFGILPFFIEPQPKEQGLNHVTWALICLMNSIATISMSVISCLSDAFAMNSSKKNKTSYGFIRLWGTIGWGISSFALAFINQTDRLPLLVPGLFMTIALLVLDIFAASVWTNKEDFNLDKSSSSINTEDLVTALSSRNTENKHQTSPPNRNYGTTMETSSSIITSASRPPSGTKYIETSSFAIQWALFKEVAKRRRSIFRYMLLFTISGALISMQWSYFFIFLKEIYANNFSFISGLSMVGQSMIGELPFFLLSKYVINLCGRSHTLSISIVSLGLRYLLYEHLLPNANMYFVLLTEAFQGPSFGLYYVVMTEVGLDYSDSEEAIISIVEKGLIENDIDQIYKLRQALRATMQSLMSACYEGLGLGIGSIVGGLVIDHYGFSTLWNYSALTAIVLGLANSMIEILKPVFVDRSSVIRA